jgi:hypothetical protein
MRWAKHVAFTGEIKNTFKILLENLERGHVFENLHVD